MRCEYCVYSGSYENRRSHNNLHEISIETARKAIDLFVKIATNKSARTIIFYGGESLMAFNVIKDIVDYANSLEEGISFAMNTNLTLLTPEIITFLVKNDFRLTVSLDGPERYMISIGYIGIRDPLIKLWKEIYGKSEIMMKNISLEI